MKKLALKLEELSVTSFVTTAAPRLRGTVVGNDATHGNTCADTCAFTCAPTCEISCVASCISTCDVAPCVPFTMDPC